MKLTLFWWFFCSGPGQGGEEEQAVKEGGLRVECLEFILLFWSNCNLHFCIIMSSIEELKYKRLHIIKNADQKIRSYKEVKWSENWFSCSFANEGNTFSCGIAWLLDFKLLRSYQNIKSKELIRSKEFQTWIDHFCASTSPVRAKPWRRSKISPNKEVFWFFWQIWK